MAHHQGQAQPGQLVPQSFRRGCIGAIRGAVEGQTATPQADGAADDAGWSSITLPIAADWERRPLRVVDAQRGQPSVTRWRALALETGSTWSLCTWRAGL